MSTGGYRGTAGQTREEFRRDITSYDSRTPFSRALKRAIGLSRFLTHEPVMVLDLMSGPGKVGQIIEEYAARCSKTVALYYNDKREFPLVTATDLPERRLVGDVRELSAIVPPGLFFDLVVVRYGIKDLQQCDQQVAFNQIARVIKPGGKLIVADMVATADTQMAVNHIHAAKQELAGRLREIEGSCHIPTLAEWKTYAHSAGFDPRIVHHDISSVTTTDWKNQFGVSEEQATIFIEQLDREIKYACRQWPDFKRVFRVDFDNHAKLEFPIMVMAAVT
ncbi:MAG: methyltransferase domain-containing protein [Candidatus Micrarchaeota archaeon]